MSNVPKCPSCGGGQFLWLTNIWFKLARQVPDFAGSQSVPGEWKANIAICTHCTRTEWYTQNVQELATNVPDARFVGA